MQLSAPAAFALFGALKLHDKTPLGFLFIISRIGSDTANSMLAVRDTYRHLEISRKRECAEAARQVYGGAPCIPFKPSQITARVRSFAAENHMDDRTVYRRLIEAKKIYEGVLSHYENLTKK